MEPLGETTKTMLFKHESHKLHQEFEVDALKATITFAGDLVTSNVINGMVNGIAIAPVTFATDHDTTMDLIVAALEALTTVVESVSLTDATNNRQITVYALNEEAAFVLSGWLVTLGAGQTTATLATDTNNVYLGQPVVLTSDGKIEPAVAHTKAQIIGISMHTSTGGEMATVEMKAMAIVFMECATDSLVAGPVKIHANGRNATTGYVEVDDASVTYENQLGWALEGGDDGDVIRVAIAV